VDSWLFRRGGATGNVSPAFLFASISVVKLRRIIAAASVVLALVLACASLDARKVGPIDEDSDQDGDGAGSILDDGATLAVTSAPPLLVPPAWRRRALCEDGMPVSRLAVVEVFRPPQPRA
jgi:hypothetical protein